MKQKKETEKQIILKKKYIFSHFHFGSICPRGKFHFPQIVEMRSESFSLFCESGKV